MLSRPIAALVVLACAVSTFATPASKASSSAAQAPALEAREVRAWLVRIHEAASRHNFQGTFVVSAGNGTMVSSRIAHFCEGPNQFERIDSLDGQMRHVFRVNDVVHTLWPAQRVAMVEQRDFLKSFPALLQAGEDRIVAHYDVYRQGGDRVAGHEANVLALNPRDGLRYGYRLWAERTTGLLLRAEVIGPHGRVLESSAFSDVTIGVKPQPQAVLQPMNQLDGYRVLRPVFTPARLDAEGWTMSRKVPGFEQVSCMRRPLNVSGPGAGEAAGAPDQVLQTIFSDGLTYVSLFIEPFDPERHAQPMQAAMGATRTLTRRHDDWWITVVGDVPLSTLRLFADGLERRK